RPRPPSPRVLIRWVWSCLTKDRVPAGWSFGDPYAREVTQDVLGTQLGVGPERASRISTEPRGRSRIAAYGGEAEDPVRAGRRRASRLLGCRRRSIGPAPHRHLGASRRGGMGLPRLRAVPATA